MSLATDIVQGGFSAGQAKAIGGQVNATVTAAGSSRTDATLIKATNTICSTVAASTGVILPTAEIGSDVWIYNAGANALTIYPHTDGTINQLTANSSISLATNTAVLLKRFSTIRWIAILSA